MIENKIIFEGKEYIKMKKIQGNRKTYIEYRNEELQKIKFFEVDKGSLKEISNKDDLKIAIEKNYIIE
ncbi:MAG: hypothetical protein IJN50_03985 [Clostridia bacterium]|nr:hypothetical protein [Clostridia bacterium]